jgi:adenine deaminase
LVNAHIIEIIENQAPTLHRIIPMTSSQGVILPEKQHDIALAAVIDRHRASGRIQLGLVKGFRLSAECAIGSTVAHDSHQMVILGTDGANMAIAANRLDEVQGGQVVVKDQTIIGQVTLPIAGLMSNEPVKVVAGQVDSVLAGFRACGCNLNNPNMQLSLLALIVIPELRLTNRGLFDVEKFSLIPLLEPPDLE